MQNPSAESPASGSDFDGNRSYSEASDFNSPDIASIHSGSEAPGEAAAEPVASSGQQRGRGGRGSRRRGRGRGQGVRSPQAAPLEPGYPPERYSRPVREAAPDVPSAGSTLAPAAPPRKARGVVVLTIGLPGSGKSSWFKRRGVTPLSSDMLRTLLFENITEQRYQDLVFSTLRSLLRARLIAGMPWNYIDATNLSPKERHGWIKMAREFGYEVHAVFFNVTLEVCMERNLRRARIVPEDVMRRMSAKLRPPTFDEGFSKIIMVKVKRALPEGGALAGELAGGDAEVDPEDHHDGQHEDQPEEPEVNGY